MAGEQEKGEGKGFKVADRRRFSPDTGEARESTEESKPSGRSDETGIANEERQDSDAAHQAPPEINFSTFVISLSTQALMNLGEISNPLTGKVEVEIPVAKQMIDILGMLREKSRGNLNPGEEKLIEDILFDLRMKYVEAVKKKK